METIMHEKKQMAAWRKPSFIGCLVLMFLAVVWAFIGLINGSVTFENELLPGNLFAYEGWLIWIFGIFAALGVVWGIIFAFKGLTERKVESYEVSAQEVRKTSDGCMAQLMGVLIAPILFGLLGYALSYYAFFLILEFCSALFPYLVGVALIALQIFYGIFVGCRLGALKAGALIAIEVVALGIYIVLAIALSKDVDVMGKASVEAGNFVESLKSKEVTEKTFELTTRGVGSLQLGSLFSDMSASNEGLYNKVKIESWEDPVSATGHTYSYELFWNDERVANFTLGRKEDPIKYICFYSPRILLPKGIRIGMTMREALKRGAKAYARTDMLDESACGIVMTVHLNKQYCLIIGDVTKQEDFSESGWKKALNLPDNAYTTIDLNEKDIASGAKLNGVIIPF